MNDASLAHDEDERRHRPRWRRLLPRRLRVPQLTLFALLLSLALGWIVWGQIQERHLNTLRIQFKAEGTELALRIDERFRGYRQVLRAARGFFEGSREVERAEWRQYVASQKLNDEYQGIQGLGFAAWLQPEDVAAHEAAVHAEGYPGYRVWPEGEREHYSAIVMLEPFDWRNQRAFGYDMYSEPVRREAMDRAVQSGESALSARVVLVQETAEDTQAGVLLYMPVFRPGAPLESEAQRRAALLGWVYSPFRMNNLMHGILGRQSEALRLRIYDGEAAGAPLLYDSRAEIDEPWASELTYIERLNLAGRSWVLKVDALPEYLRGLAPRPTELFALGVIGLLLVAVTWTLATTRENARKLGRMADAVKRSQARYSALVNLAHEGIASTDAELRLTFVNPRLAEMLGRPAHALLGQPIDDFWGGFSSESRKEAIARLRRGEVLRHEVECLCPDGGKRTVLVSDAPLTDAGGRFTGAIVMLTDISERKAAERRIHHLATHDPLTGVPNRMMFGDLLTQALARAERYEHRFALLFIDLDHFKEVNDNCGHLIGDQLLVEAANRMQHSIRGADELGRQGGDEFMVLLPEIESEQDAEVVAEKIRAALAEPFEIDGNVLHISSSIGIVLYPDHGRSADELLRHADEAMYRAKSEGRNRSYFFFP